MSAPLLHAQAPQPGRRYRVGVLLPVDTSAANHLPVIREQLAARGFVDGRNLDIDVRYARTNADAAQELLARKPDAILAATDDSVRTAQAATRSTPIVFTWVADPVVSGFVKTYGRPGGNATGIANRYYELTVKRVELLHELLPGATRIGILYSEKNPSASAFLGTAEKAAASARVTLARAAANAPEELAAAVQRLVREKVQAVAVPADPMMLVTRGVLNELLAKDRLPGAFGNRDHALEGALVSYAPDIRENFRMAAGYVDRILRGADPATLPVEQSSKVELIVNLRTAKALGITVPRAVLLRADRVIE